MEKTKFGIEPCHWLSVLIYKTISKYCSHILKYETKLKVPTEINYSRQTNSNDFIISFFKAGKNK